MRRSIAIVIAAVLLGGCVAKPRTLIRETGAVPATQPAPATTQAADKSSLRFNEIRPRPRLATTRPATTMATTAPAPLDALELFARARAAMKQDQRYTAIALL